jgi:hypothetical protein
METLRDIEDVHKKIMLVIPDQYNELKNDLHKYISSLWNLAPELRNSRFTYIPYQNILLKYLDSDELDKIWTVQVQNIFNGNE